MPRTFVSSIVILGAALAAVACGDAPEQERFVAPPVASAAPVASSTALQPLAGAKPLAVVFRRELAAGGVFEVLEAAPGEIAFSESGIAPNPPQFRPGERPASAVEAFRVIAPGEAIPAELEAADARARALVPSEPSAAPSDPRHAARGSALPPPDVHVEDYGGSCDSTWFKANFCKSETYSWCLLDWWGGAYEQGNAWITSQAACADIGSILYTVTTSSGYGGQWSLGQGGWHQFWWTGSTSTTWYGGTNFNQSFVRGTVTNAASSRFHYGGFFYIP